MHTLSSRQLLYSHYAHFKFCIRNQNYLFVLNKLSVDRQKHFQVKSKIKYTLFHFYRNADSFAISAVIPKKTSSTLFLFTSMDPSISIYLMHLLLYRMGVF